MRWFWVSLTACVALAASSVAVADVGFFAPSGLTKSVIDHTQIGLESAVSPAHLEQQLALMRGTDFKAYVDVGDVIALPRSTTSIGTQYRTPDGESRNKRFVPQSPSYLRIFPSDRDIERLLEPIIAVLANHKRNVGAVFLADEPYVHGISKSEMERAAHVVRRMLNKRGLASVKLGVIFASGMFDSSYAHLIDGMAGKYAQEIDDYYDAQKDRSSGAFSDWVTAVQQHRLVTYDGAGNIYVGGGLPNGFDIYGYDFYLSTFLLDGTHEDTLRWLADHFPNGQCGQFAGRSTSSVRSTLSFFKGDRVLGGREYQDADRRLLDALYACRMGAITGMLKRAAAGRDAELLFVSESSDNGVLEFSPAGVVEPAQPRALIDSRVLDEVGRAEKFYAEHVCLFTGGLLFFTYQDTYDPGIKLKIGGARGIPAVMSSIYSFASRAKAVRKKAGCTAR